jgi:hypothetical protein
MNDHGISAHVEFARLISGKPWACQIVQKYGEECLVLHLNTCNVVIVETPSFAMYMGIIEAKFTGHEIYRTIEPGIENTVNRVLKEVEILGLK